MKAEVAIIWASCLLGLAAARPASKKSCAPSQKPSSTYKASSVTFASYDGPPSGVPVDQGNMATLLPGIFWDQDMSNMDNLIPESKCKLFYAQHDNAKKPGQIAQAEYKMKYPTVALEHTRYVSAVSCSQPDHMDISFRDRASYLWAKRHWIPYNSETNDTMVIVGRFPGCNPTKDDGMRSWSLVDDVTFNDATYDVDATIKYMEMKDVVEGATIQVGNYVPNGQKPAPAGGPKAAGAEAAVPDPTPAHAFQRPYYASVAAATTAPTASGKIAADYGRWGPDFDIKKDDKIGYMDASRAVITPAPVARSTTDVAHYKRWGWNPWENITSAFKIVTDEVKDIASHVASAVSGAASAIESGAKAVATDAANVINDFTSYTHHLDLPSLAIKVDVNEGPTPFRDLPGRKLFEDVGGVTLYCVDCGAEGSAHFSATVTFSLLHGIESGSLDFAGNIKARVSVGMVNNNPNIQLPFPKSADYEVFNVGLPSLSIPNILTVGPYIALDVIGSVSIGATGLIRAGFELEIEKPTFHADIKDLSKSTASGWEPKFKPILDLNGNLTLNAELQTPISLNFGINVLKGKFETAISLSEAPTVKFSMINRFDGSLNPGALKNPEAGGLINGSFGPNTGNCLGSMLALRVGLDTIIGIKKSAMSYSLFKLDIYKNEWCIQHNIFSLLNNPTRRALDAPNPEYSSGRINTATNDLSIVSGINGNVYVDSAAPPQDSNGNNTSYQWLSWNNLVVGAQDGRLLYAYSDELESHSVSRFRLGSWEHVPKTAKQVALLPSDDLMTASILGDKKKFLYPIACTYKTQPTKMFLAVDIIEGIKKLQDPKLQDEITGGEVHACGFLKWKNTDLKPFVPTGGQGNKTDSRI
ncbi:hypothetical protein Dda_5694 [Drechslerella dactyloides]|uniref:Uncharacterized protein n=1 Tax=Drechslerella dactyloides TaxID=74499 RepID=A0AAD6NKF5_DREDA|nr:hypothetical protein Dda_5694 [Drechslerella dactyloides]